VIPRIDLDVLSELSRAREVLARLEGSVDHAAGAVEAARGSHRRAVESRDAQRATVARLEAELRSEQPTRYPLLAAIEEASAAAAAPRGGDYDRDVASALEAAEASRAARGRPAVREIIPDVSARGGNIPGTHSVITETPPIIPWNGNGHPVDRHVERVNRLAESGALELPAEPDDWDQPASTILPPEPLANVEPPATKESLREASKPPAAAPSSSTARPADGIPAPDSAEPSMAGYRRCTRAEYRAAPKSDRHPDGWRAVRAGVPPATGPPPDRRPLRDKHAAELRRQRGPAQAVPALEELAAARAVVGRARTAREAKATFEEEAPDGGKPEPRAPGRQAPPTADELDRLLIHACRQYDPSMRQFWEAATDGAFDDAIRFFLCQRWPKSRVFVGPDRTHMGRGYTIQVAGETPILWVGPFVGIGHKADLAGQELVDRVRRVFGIPDPRAAEKAAPPAAVPSREELGLPAIPPILPAHNDVPRGFRRATESEWMLAGAARRHSVFRLVREEPPAPKRKPAPAVMAGPDGGPKPPPKPRSPRASGAARRKRAAAGKEAARAE